MVPCLSGGDRLFLREAIVISKRSRGGLYDQRTRGFPTMVSTEGSAEVYIVGRKQDRCMYMYLDMGGSGSGIGGPR